MIPAPTMEFTRLDDAPNMDDCFFGMLLLLLVFIIGIGISVSIGEVGRLLLSSLSLSSRTTQPEEEGAPCAGDEWEPADARLRNESLSSWCC